MADPESSSGHPAPPTPAPEPAFFDNPAIDNLIAVTLELGAELWVQRERMRVVETLLAQKDYIERILRARVYEVAIESPLDPAARLSRRLGNRVCSSARTCSRCSRSSCAARTTRSRASPRPSAQRGVIAPRPAITRRAWRSRAAPGIPAVIVMPQTTPPSRSRRCATSAAKSCCTATTTTTAYDRTRSCSRARSNLVFVHPFDDPDVIAGQGTIGMEILRQQRPASSTPCSCRSAAAG
jgi:hypothetical protein